jgi:hypothetical protein
MKSFEEFINEVLVTFGGKAYPPANNAVILAGGAGCYPGDTEFFTGSGWQKISEYDDERVLQFDPSSGKASMVIPDNFIQIPVDDFHTIKNRRCDFTTSLNHNHLLISEKTGKLYTAKTSDIISKHASNARGNKAKLLTSFLFDGPGIDMVETMIRLKIAIIADGHFMPRIRKAKCRVSLKKPRKIERFRMLLHANGIDYDEYTENGFIRFQFFFGDEEKEFSDYWYQCNQAQLKVVCDEVIKWDGSIVERTDRKNMNSFSTTSEKFKDFIQFAFSACGHDVTVHEDIREERTLCYQVVINHSSSVGIAKDIRHNKSTEIKKYSDDTGMMYCFTVPSGFFVVRQKGKIYVSGNSGKGYVLGRLIGIEGKVFDVDAIKQQMLKNDKLKAEFKKDLQMMISNGALSSMPDLDDKNLLKNPKHVSALHNTAERLGIPQKVQNAFFDSLTNKDNLPNVIFDVTLKDIIKLHNLTELLIKNGYDKKNIHLVWIVNDITMAIDQNLKRRRVVPENILIATHEGAARTMADILMMSEGIKHYLDGDIWIVPNKAGVDSKFISTDNEKSNHYLASMGDKNKKQIGYLIFADKFLIKKAGKPIDITKMSADLEAHIKEYVPKDTFEISK